MTRSLIPIFVFALILGFCVSHAQAVVVFVKGRDKPIIGIIKLKDERFVVVEQVLANGTRPVTRVPRADIEDIIETVVPERLEKLDPDTPQAYHDYAEELTVKRDDPEAREMAMRLYLIAAHLDPKNHGRSSLLGMVQLARNDDEERILRAMAYLLDPEHNESVLRDPDIVKKKPQSVDDVARQRLLTAIRQVRQQQRQHLARETAMQEEVRALFEQLEDIMSQDEFIKASAERELSPHALEKLITLELALLPSTGVVDRPQATRKLTSWLQGINRDGLASVPPLSLNPEQMLKNVTEFDPNECFFRNGKWTSSED